MTVLIAGGGIGGLKLDLSLHQIEVACRVLESVPALKPLGRWVLASMSCPMPCANYSSLG
jgi:2-polyprenyl-6-methoxyphenol hydroxylase-like FAD-dependent oxidoreductase